MNSPLCQTFFELLGVEAARASVTVVDAGADTSPALVGIDFTEHDQKCSVIFSNRFVWSVMLALLALLTLGTPFVFGKGEGFQRQTS